MGIGIAIKSLWETGTLENDEEVIMINPELLEVWAKINNGKLKKNTEQGISDNKGGSSIRKKYETPKVEVVNDKEKLEEMTKKLRGEDNQR